MYKAQPGPLPLNMTYSTNHFDPSHHPADLDIKPDPQFDDFDNMLSASAMERKDSFATTSTFFSPQSATTPWGEESFSMPASTNSSAHPDRHLSISSQMGEPTIGSNNPFLNPQFSWAVYDRGVESKTPMPTVTYDAFGSDFETTTAAAFQPSTSGASSFGGVPMLNNVRPAAIMQPAAGAPLSVSPPPQSNKEWMALAEQDLDTGRLPKRIRQNSPPRPLTPGFARRDGVRKKNARFEIPEGRNLQNIDRLISQATDEDDIKELKQQKRLLRNRQAAYDSLSIIWFYRTGFSYLVLPILALLT